MHKIKSGKIAWHWTIIILLLVLLISGCVPQTAVEIQRGTVPQREETYDDIVNCGPSIDTYRIDCNMNPRTDQVKETQNYLSECICPAIVKYRDSIETTAGQTRYNIFYIAPNSTFLRLISVHIYYPLSGSPIMNYEIRLADNSANIDVKNVGQYNLSIQPGAGDVEIQTMLYIPSLLKPGDYTLNFILAANGLYCGDLPCIIHVTE